MNITVYGPNLTGKLSAKGEMHVHLRGCADERNYRGCEIWEFEAADRVEIVQTIFDWEEITTDNVNDWGVWFAPCTKELK